MRPVVRGSCPTDGGGSPIKFSDYKEARDALISTMGNYCSYCETALHSAIDVEHVSPKSHHAELELEWTNFLLACDYCNPVKGHSDILLDDYIWPDRDNTSMAFAYQENHPPGVADRLSQQDRAVAQNTLELTGLDRVPGHPRYQSARSSAGSSVKKHGAWHSYRSATSGKTTRSRCARAIVQTAISLGFWSVWMQVFEQDNDMRRRSTKTVSRNRRRLL